MRTYAATLKYTQSLAYKISMFYAQRQLGRVGIAGILLLVLGLGLAHSNGYDFTFTQVIGLTIVGCFAIYFWFRFEIQRRWLDKLKSMGKPEAQLVVNEETFTVSSGAGSSTIPWKRFTDLWKQDEYWLLFIGKYSAPITIPLEGVDANVLQLIEEKIGEAKKSNSA